MHVYPFAYINEYHGNEVNITSWTGIYRYNWLVLIIKCYGI